MENLLKISIKLLEEELLEELEEVEEVELLEDVELVLLSEQAASMAVENTRASRAAAVCLLRFNICSSFFLYQNFLLDRRCSGCCHQYTAGG